MDVGSFFGALTGGGGFHNNSSSSAIKIDIRLSPPNPDNVQMIDHPPSWKLHKNPFWKCQHSLSPPKQQPQPPQPVAVEGNNDSGYYSNEVRPVVVPPKLGKNAGYIYESSQDVAGSIIIHHNHPMMSPNQKHHPTMSHNHTNNSNSAMMMEHLGVSIQFIGRVDMSNSSAQQQQHTNFNSNNTEYDFIHMSKELLPPGILNYHPNSNNNNNGNNNSSTIVPFRFKNIDIDYESYTGRMVAVRYILRVKIERKFGATPIVQEKDIWFQIIPTQLVSTLHQQQQQQPQTLNNNTIPPSSTSIVPARNERIKMEVGIEDCLHIEFEYNQRYYHLQDTIYGSIKFLLVLIKLKHMELAIIRREYSSDGSSTTSLNNNDSQQAMSGNNNTIDTANVYTETQTLVKYEIMDGAPVKGEIIPVKLSLLGIPADLTPTYTAIHHRFSVKYFINLVLVDEDDRRYFKQQEIILYRKYIGQ